MLGPEGQEHWSIQEYTSISPKTNFKLMSAFTDKDENINEEMPGSEWDLNFTDAEGITTVRISIREKNLASLEQIIKMGFKEGFTMILNYLETLLKDLK